MSEKGFFCGSKHSKGTIRVLVKCNLHGLWEASKEIAIKQT